MLDKLLTVLEDFRNSRHTIDTTKLVEPKVDADYVEIFKHEVVNRISLAVSLSSHLNSAISPEELERKMYAHDALDNLKNALSTLKNELLMSEFFKKVKSKDFEDVRLIRIEEMVLLSEKIYKRIKDVLGDSNDEINSELSTTRDLIETINIKLHNEI